MNRHFQIITISLIAICSNIWGQTSFTVNGLDIRIDKKSIKQEVGSIIPSFGITVEF